jgi:hypothetical protein
VRRGWGAASYLRTQHHPPTCETPRLSTDRNRRPSINRGSGSAELNWRVWKPAMKPARGPWSVVRGGLATFTLGSRRSARKPDRHPYAAPRRPYRRPGPPLVREKSTRESSSASLQLNSTRERVHRSLVDRAPGAADPSGGRWSGRQAEVIKIKIKKGNILPQPCSCVNSGVNS